MSRRCSTAALDSATLQIVMHGSLFLAARRLLDAAASACRPSARWQAIFLLLLTGKLSCLLGALLIFAPRLLYAADIHAPSFDIGTLDDQQLAGLLMITACPLSYVVAGVVLAARMIG